RVRIPRSGSIRCRRRFDTRSWPTGSASRHTSRRGPWRRAIAGSCTPRRWAGCSDAPTVVDGAPRSAGPMEEGSTFAWAARASSVSPPTCGPFNPSSTGSASAPIRAICSSRAESPSPADPPASASSPALPTPKMEARMTSKRFRIQLVIAAAALSFATSAAAQTHRVNIVEPDLANRMSRIIQTNSASDLVHIIDPTTQQIVGVIEGVPHNHGAVLHADGEYYYFTNEHDNTVDVVDTRSLRIVKQIPLAATPNNLSGSDVARKVYVAISGAPLVQVIDMDTNEVIKNIPVPGGVHNTFVTPDGKFAVAGMIGASTISVIDTSTDEVAWELEFDGG